MLRRLAAMTAMVVALGTSYLTGGAWADTVPAAPTVSVSGDTAVVSWAPVAGAGGYRVQISVTDGARWLDVGYTDSATTSLEVDDLRSPSNGCGPGACSVIAHVASVLGATESAYSPSSTPVAIPVPFSFPMSVWRHNGSRSVTLVLYGRSLRAGQVVHLYQQSREKVWEDTGRTTTVHRQRVPGRRSPVVAWVFKVVVRAHGLSNYRAEVPAVGQVGEGWSRPYGVRR